MMQHSTIKRLIRANVEAYGTPRERAMRENIGRIWQQYIDPETSVVDTDGLSARIAHEAGVAVAGAEFLVRDVLMRMEYPVIFDRLIDHAANAVLRGDDVNPDTIWEAVAAERDEMPFWTEGWAHRIAEVVNAVD